MPNNILNNGLVFSRALKSLIQNDLSYFNELYDCNPNPTIVIRIKPLNSWVMAILGCILSF